jgi:sugar lactone lactonase YvrE
MYIADTNNNRIRRVDKNGVVTTVAGAGSATYDQDAACLPDNASILNHPRAVTVDAVGNLYIADMGKGRVRKIAPDGTANDIVPAATKWFAVPISQPIGVAVDGSGNVSVADADSSRVVEIGPNGAAIQSVSVAAHRADRVRCVWESAHPYHEPLQRRRRILASFEFVRLRERGAAPGREHERAGVWRRIHPARFMSAIPLLR